MSTTLISAATFTRTSVASYLDKDLIVTQKAASTVRDGNFFNKGTKTLLLEETRTNLALRSETFDNASWTKTRCSASANSTTAPNDAAEADSIVEDSSSSATHFVEQNVTITANATIAFSVMLKLSTRTFASLVCEDSAATNGFKAWFNLTTGAGGTTGTNGSGATFTAARIQEVGNGFYRCELVGNLASGITSCDLRIHLADSDNSISYNGNGASLIFAWGAQLEDDSAFASSYIATTSASVARTVENIKWTFSSIPQPMTIYVRFVERGTALMTAGTKILQIGKADDSDPMITIEAAGSTVYRASHDNNVDSAVTASGTITTVDYGDMIELRLVLFSDGAIQLHQSEDGAAEASTSKTAAHTLAAAWGDTLLWLNSVGTTGEGFCAFHAVKICPGEQTLAFMRDYNRNILLET